MIPLIGKWTMLPGKQEQAIPLLKELANQVKETEPGTLIYKVFTPDFTRKSLPTPADGEVIFFEVYKDDDAYQNHVREDGPFQKFVEQYGQLLFLNDFANQLYFTLEMLQEQAGFIREDAL